MPLYQLSYAVGTLDGPVPVSLYIRCEGDPYGRAPLGVIEWAKRMLAQYSPDVTTTDVEVSRMNAGHVDPVTGKQLSITSTTTLATRTDDGVWHVY